MESKIPVKAKYRLGKVTNKYLILDILSYSFWKQSTFIYLLKTSRNLRQLLIQNLLTAQSTCEDALLHIKELPSTLTDIDLGKQLSPVSFVLLSGNSLYTDSNRTLQVFSLTDLSASPPIASYPLEGDCFSGIVIGSRLYLGVSDNCLQVFEVSTSLTQPLTIVSVIRTTECVHKILIEPN
jgi:hypothetical protein